MRIQAKLQLALNTISNGFKYIDSRDVKCGSEHAYRLPMGKCSSDVERRLDSLSAAVGAPVELIDRGGAVIVRVVENDFPAKLKYNEADLRDDKLLIGYNRLMNPIYHRPMHLLSGGAAGSGKTVWLRFILYQLARMKAVIKIADLKGFSFFPFEALPRVEVAKNMEATADLLFAALTELERRETMIIQRRDRSILKDFPYYAVVIDEAAQISPKMNSGKMKEYAKFCDESVARIAQKGRESKVILIYCTQRPAADIVNGQVKSNVEAAVAFRTYTDYDSRIILNTEGAEKISVATPGRCLFRGEHFHTLQVPFIGESDREWEKLLAPLKVEVLQHGSSHRSEPPRKYIEGSFRSADRHDETAGNAERFAKPKNEGFPSVKGTPRGKTGSRKVSPSREDMAPQQTRKATKEYTDEVAD